MNSNKKSAYVWVWLPNVTTPVLAGKIELIGTQYSFHYGRSYCENANAIALSPDELPLISNERFLPQGILHRVLSDALPDAWGRRILHFCYPDKALSLLDYLLLSGPNRIGALHFQTELDSYKTRSDSSNSLEQLMNATSHIDQGEPLPADVELALFHGTSIGGARPKVLLFHENKHFIAKFSASTDTYPIVQAEYAAMWLANKLGLVVAPVELVSVNKRWVLLVERFDREYQNNMWQRKFLVSALTRLQLEEHEGRYASYLTLADAIRIGNRNPNEDLTELFRRIVYNILIGNTDDHAKN